MKCSELLREEHAYILDRMEKVETLLQDLTNVDRREFTNFFEFVREFVDEYHHQKEEGFYFKWMVKRNPQMEHGPIACMLGEHDQGRNLIISAEKNLNQNKTEQFKEDVLAFILLLRGHIDKENTVLYMMADGIDAKTNDGDSNLLPAFEEINKNLVATAEKFSFISKKEKEDAPGECCGSCT